MTVVISASLLSLSHFLPSVCHPHAPVSVLSACLTVIPDKCFLPPAPGHSAFHKGALGGKVTPTERIFHGGLPGVLTTVGGLVAVGLHIVGVGWLSVRLSGQFSLLRKRTKINV